MATHFSNEMIENQFIVISNKGHHCINNNHHLFF